LDLAALDDAAWPNICVAALRNASDPSRITYRLSINPASTRARAGITQAQSSKFPKF